MRPFSITNVTSRWGGAPVPSISVAWVSAVTCAVALTARKSAQAKRIYEILAFRFGLCFGGSGGAGGQGVGDELLGAFGVFFGDADFFRETGQGVVAH